MALQRPGLIRHGRCRSRALVIYQRPLIIHAQRNIVTIHTHPTPPLALPVPVFSLLSTVPHGCMRTALAHWRPAHGPRCFAAVAHPSHGPAKRTLSTSSGS